MNINPESNVFYSNLKKAKIAGAMMAVASLLIGFLFIFILPDLLLGEPEPIDLSSSFRLFNMLFYAFTLAFFAGLVFAVCISIYIGSRRGELIFKTKSDLFLEGFIDGNIIYLSTVIIILIFSVHVHDYRHVGEVMIDHFIRPFFWAFVWGLIPLLIIGSVYWWLLKKYINALERSMQQDE